MEVARVSPVEGFSLSLVKPSGCVAEFNGRAV
jgi:hypothetical protein